VIDTTLDDLLHRLRLPVDHDHWAQRLRRDPLFAVEMKVCREWGIPHSTFLGGQDDPDSEPVPPGTWSRLDREKAIAYVLHENQRCGSCGTHPIDWPTEDDEPFEVEGRRCFGCQATQRWLDDYRQAATLRNGEQDPKATWGLFTVLRPKSEE